MHASAIVTIMQLLHFTHGTNMTAWNSFQTVNIQYYSGMYATPTLYVWYKYDSMKQFPNSQLPITFTSNTECSVVLDIYVLKRK